MHISSHPAYRFMVRAYLWSSHLGCNNYTPHCSFSLFDDVGPRLLVRCHADITNNAQKFRILAVSKARVVVFRLVGIFGGRRFLQVVVAIGVAFESGRIAVDCTCMRNFGDKLRRTDAKKKNNWSTTVRRSTHDCPIERDPRLCYTDI